MHWTTENRNTFSGIEVFFEVRKELLYRERYCT